MIHIRVLREEDDLRDLIALSKEFFREYEAHHKDFFKIGQLTDSDVIDYFSRWIGDENGETFVALADTRIVGYVTVHVREQAAYWQIKKVGEISGLMVRRDYRRKGIASQLLAHARSFFAERAVRYFTVYTAVENKAAIGFYERNGLMPLQTTMLGVSNTGAPRLETRRLILRAITPDDRFAVFENYSDPDVAKWFFEQAYTQIEQADQIIHEFVRKSTEGKGLAWAILFKESGEFLGTCSYEKLGAKLQGEIGFDLAKKHWGQGYMTEALEAIISYGFTALGLVKIEAHTYSRNSRARRVLEKLGFKVDSVREDSHCYTLDRTDWMRIRP